MNAERGSALTETLVGLLAILPAFWAMDYLGRLHDMQRATVAGARYAAWEEIAGRAAGPSIDRAIQHRIYGSDRAGLIGDHRLRTRDPSANPLWRDRLGALRPARPQEPSSDERFRRKALPRAGLAVRNIAHGESVPGLAGLGGLSGAMLGLDREGLPTHTAHLAAQARLENTGRRDPVRLQASAAISPGAWQALDDSDYQRRTERIVASEPVSTISQPARQLGRFFVFKEGRHARSTDFIPPSRILPPGR